MLFLYCPPLLFKICQRSGSCCCCLEPFFCKTLNSNDRQYSQPQHEALLCKTLNTNGRQYNTQPQHEPPILSIISD
jgi:hypothetical protein